METRFFVRRLLFLYFVATCACAPVVATTPQPPSTPSAPSAAAAAQRAYRILITNDDGVRAPGILAVAQALQSLGEITIAAPARSEERRVGEGGRVTGAACEEDRSEQS